MSNSSSTSTGAPETTSFSQTPSPSTSSQASVPSSSSIANSSPSSSGTTTEITSIPTSTSITLPTFTSSTSTSISTTPTSTTTTSTTPTSASTTPTTSRTTTAPPTIISTITETPTSPGGSTITRVITSTQGVISPSNTGSSSSSSTSAASTAGLQPSNSGVSKGLSSGGTIAVAVVVPIVAVALIIAAGLFFWRKRKQRKDAEELRRKEVEEYGYNPNNDPSLPVVAGGSASGGGDGPYEMREDGSAGYRGWGTTAVASSGRKASTTLSGGQSAGGIGMAYSEGTSPTHGAVSDTRSDNPLMERPLSGEVEPLGAMGPAASGNRSDINRGPSNASSQYSAAGRSDGSGEIPGGFGGGQYYNNQYDTGNPYGADTQYGSPPGRAEMPAQPVIRDVQARRNTRIENPAHFPQQSAGISQNF